MAAPDRSDKSTNGMHAPGAQPADDIQRWTAGRKAAVVLDIIKGRAQSGGPGAGGGDWYKFLSVSSRGNLHTDFPSADAGKIGGAAYFALRWVSTPPPRRGEKGPWSEVAAATVAA